MPRILQFILGMLGGVLVALPAAGFVGGFLVGRANATARRVPEGGLTPVIVAVGDLAPDTEFTQQVLAVREVPSAFVTPSVVTPDKVHLILHHPLAGPVSAGDPIRWDDVLILPTGAEDAYAACAGHVPATLPAKPSTVAALRERALGSGR